MNSKTGHLTSDPIFNMKYFLDIFCLGESQQEFWKTVLKAQENQV